MSIRFEGRATLAVAVLAVACGGGAKGGGLGGAGGGGGAGGTGGGVYQRGPDPTITAGVDHSCVVSADGALYCWGSNASAGQIGDGTFEHRSTPTRVGTDNDWVSVTSASEHTCARKNTGAAFCWGRNDKSSLGSFTIDYAQNTPIPLEEGARWLSVVGGIQHGAGIKLDGSLWGWGSNFNGELGVGDNTYRDNPTRAGMANDWVEVAASWSGTCARKRDDTLWCWGDQDANSPRELREELTDWTHIAAFGSNLCGIRAPGSLWCWTSEDDEPVQKGTDEDWTAVSPGSAHICGIRAGGELFCWGNDDEYGQMGTGFRYGAFEPMRVGSDTDWTEIAGGGHHTCGKRADGSLWCWGSTTYGQVGNGVMGHTPEPTQVGEATDWVEAAAGDYTTCAVNRAGELWCFGDDKEGTLGNGSVSMVLAQSPARVGDDTDWVSIQGNATRMVGLKGNNPPEEGNEVYAIGYVPLNGGGGSDDPRSISSSKPFTSVSAGFMHDCGVTADKTFWCWGNGGYGALGAQFPSGSTPNQIGEEADWISGAAGGMYSCGVRETGQLFCFGGNYVGQAGIDNMLMDTHIPTEVAAGGSWAKVFAGHSHGCVLDTEGHASCWGSNDGGNTGTGLDAQYVLPSPVLGGHSFLSLSLHWFSCGIRDDHALLCWGRLVLGPTRDNEDITLEEPTVMGTDNDWASVAVGMQHVCGVKTDGTLWCFGANERGQLGLGTTYTAELTQIPVP
jgi:alpha-tubulin suppressor-like RCC1 family protein